MRHAVTLVHDQYIIQINGFSAVMDDPHNMIAGGKCRGTPHEVEGLLVEAVWLIVNDNRHRPEILPALIAQAESSPGKAEGRFIPNAIGDMQGAAIRVCRSRIFQSSPVRIIRNIGIYIIIIFSRWEWLHVFWCWRSRRSRRAFRNGGAR